MPINVRGGRPSQLAKYLSYSSWKQWAAYSKLVCSQDWSLGTIPSPCFIILHRHFPPPLNFETKVQTTSQSLSMKGQGFGGFFRPSNKRGGAKGAAEECCVCSYPWLDSRTTVLPMVQLMLDLPQKYSLHPWPSPASQMGKTGEAISSWLKTSALRDTWQVIWENDKTNFSIIVSNGIFQARGGGGNQTLLVFPSGKAQKRSLW